MKSQPCRGLAYYSRRRKTSLRGFRVEQYALRSLQLNSNSLCDIVGHLAGRRKETELVIFDPAFPLVGVVAPAAQRSALMLQLFRFATFSTTYGLQRYTSYPPPYDICMCVCRIKGSTRTGVRSLVYGDRRRSWLRDESRVLCTKYPVNWEKVDFLPLFTTPCTVSSSFYFIPPSPSHPSLSDFCVRVCCFLSVVSALAPTRVVDRNPNEKSELTRKGNSVVVSSPCWYESRTWLSRKNPCIVVAEKSPVIVS